jgi:hypothetical protein
VGRGLAPVPLLAEGVAERVCGFGGVIVVARAGARRAGRLGRAELQRAPAELLADGSGGGELVSVELEEVVRRGQQPPFRSDG